MLELKTDRLDCADYEQDMVLWFEHQITLLRQRRFAELDLNNLIEELDSIVRHERRALESRIRVLLMHLLKCQFQHDRISGSWLGTLDEQRFQIDRLLQDSPSLVSGLGEVVARAYPSAVHGAASETGLCRDGFPKVNPYTIEQLLDVDFVPAPSSFAATPSP
jgi:hypothetical protein